MKLLILALLVWLGFIAFKKLRRPASTVEGEASKRKMLACSRCQTHVPESEAIIHNNKVYCSKDCL